MVFFKDLDGVNEKVCFCDPYNDLGPFLKDLYKFSLERIGYKSIKRKTGVVGKVDKDITSLFMVFDYINCSI